MRADRHLVMRELYFTFDFTRVQYREAKEEEILEKESNSASKSVMGVSSLCDLEARGSEGCSVDTLLQLLQRLYCIMEQSNPGAKNGGWRCMCVAVSLCVCVCVCVCVYEYECLIYPDQTYKLKVT